jgi:hypothetical protein
MDIGRFKMFFCDLEVFVMMWERADFALIIYL